VKLHSIISGLAVAAVALLPTVALAGTVASGFNTSTLAANDDNFTGAINLGFSANFYGTTYTQTFVSNNGYITFNTGQGTFTPSGLGAGYSGQPIIAAFFADVDTDGAGSGLTSWGTGTYAGRGAFGVTWPGVGYYSSHTDKLNTFQIILTDRSDVGAGDFDIYLNYNQIQWEEGDFSGGSGGLSHPGTTSAAAGFNAGTGVPGTYFELLGSLVHGAFLDGGPDSLVAGTNDGTPGQFLFQVRGGTIIVEPPPEGVPEPITLTVFGAGLVGAAALRRRMKKS